VVWDRVETTVFSATATLTDDKLEDDSDYQLMLRDPQGRTMTAEIPRGAPERRENATSGFLKSRGVRAFRPEFHGRSS
jgi:hypothetical protein